MEKSLEWNSPVFVTFVDYEKAFNSIDRVVYVLWKLLCHMASLRNIAFSCRRTTRNAPLELSKKSCLRC